MHKKSCTRKANDAPSGRRPVINGLVKCSPMILQLSFRVIIATLMLEIFSDTFSSFHGQSLAHLSVSAHKIVRRWESYCFMHKLLLAFSWGLWCPWFKGLHEAHHKINFTHDRLYHIKSETKIKPHLRINSLHIGS